ncbi:hypothetical protein IA69_21250 [Massilia sp. JS1662]|jgi:hypothetical protein|nr:hypothetical protein [Massilia sp. JS1662]KGF79950.1 hypothetical protein IA69_21250 [Massilia sp. JS1662]MCS0614422.1 hypothetical protein [Massilia kyonggiensis]
MKTLIIKDLSVASELDRDTMAAVRGGYNMSQTSWYPLPSPTYGTTVDATQNLTQFQNVVNATANGSAFVNGVTANNNTSQFGQNNIAVI